MRYPQKLFRGIAVGYDPTDIKKEYCVDCKNVKISTKGQLQSIPGMEKQITTGLGDQIMAVHQIDDEEFVVQGGNIQKL